MELNALEKSPMGRRGLLKGALGGVALLAVPACSNYPFFSLEEAVRRLMLLSSERAFARLTAPGGYWDEQVAQIGLGNLLGARGDILSRILTSSLFRSRLQDTFADIAIEGTYRAAPVVADAVRVIGLRNAVDLVRGGPRAATTALRGELGGRLIDVMVPELGQAMRVASDPLVGELLNAATGVNVSGFANRLAGNIDDAIWNEMGYEEQSIRANPESTNDAAIIGVFGAGARL